MQWWMHCVKIQLICCPTSLKVELPIVPTIMEAPGEEGFVFGQKMEKVKKHLLKITEIPFGTTTASLIDSILSANDKGKSKFPKLKTILRM